MELYTNAGHKRSKFVRVIFMRYKKTFSWRRGETIQKPLSTSFCDNVFKTLIERFIKTKPNWNQYETFWKRFVFAAPSPDAPQLDLHIPKLKSLS